MKSGSPTGADAGSGQARREDHKLRNPTSKRIPQVIPKYSPGNFGENDFNFLTGRQGVGKVCVNGPAVSSLSDTGSVGSMICRAPHGDQ